MDALEEKTINDVLKEGSRKRLRRCEIDAVECAKSLTREEVDDFLHGLWAAGIFIPSGLSIIQTCILGIMALEDFDNARLN